MGKYRIIEFCQRNGVVYYCVQKRVLGLFWVYITEIRDMSMAAYRKTYDTIREAESEISRQIAYKISWDNSKIRYKKVIQTT